MTHLAHAKSILSLLPFVIKCFKCVTYIELTFYLFKHLYPLLNNKSNFILLPRSTLTLNCRTNVGTLQLYTNYNACFI